MSANSGIHFEVSERKVLLRIFDVLSMLLGLYLVGTIFNFEYFRITANNWEWIFVLIIYFILLANVFELYDLQKSSKFETIFPDILIVSSITTLLYLLTPFFTPVLPENRLQIVYFLFAITASVLLWRWAYIFFITSPVFNKRYVLVGNLPQIKLIHDVIVNTSHTSTVLGYYNLNPESDFPDDFPEMKQIDKGSLKEIVAKNKVSEVIIAHNGKGTFNKELFQDLIALLENGIPIREYAQVYEELTNRVPVQYVGNEFYRYFPFSRTNKNRLYLFLNRVVDIFAGSLGMLFCGICIPFIALGNRIGSRGGLFYTQKRTGRNGVPFDIYKFRSMVVNAEADGVKWAAENDTRVTPFGKFLRKSRLDEIPQFYNVLKGDMSLIGPRPERPEFVAELSTSFPFYETRHIVKPGITGWAQVCIAYGASKEDSLKKLQYDLYYIKHRSFFLDIRIIVKTLSTVLFYRGR
ncbi:exopolysaccharide biosynthesis polyprenyl glycosylphosphotransferase [Ascidiimonas sp. W6]|uniref:sugar transferase n=1 Tax=Ascidiimonas meishanensis TaxID=3128903 RepID=UPI0030EB5289